MARTAADQPADTERAKISRDAFLYLDPQGDPEQFAQCGSCHSFMPTAERCAWLGGEHVEAGWSCGGYGYGEPDDDQPITHSMTVAEAGLVQRAVRCQNCRFRQGEEHCGLFDNLNQLDPETFDLDPGIDFYGCCNANMPRDQEEEDEEPTRRLAGVLTRRVGARDRGPGNGTGAENQSR